MAKSKLNLEGLREEVMRHNKEAQEFVNAAKSNSSPVGHENIRSVRKLVVEGTQKGKENYEALTFFVKKEYPDWLAKNGSGGKQIMLNYLLQRGIEAIEAEYKSNGIVWVTEERE